MSQELFNKLLILRTPGIGAARFNALVGAFGGVDAAAASLNADSAHGDAVRYEMDRAASLGITYISDDDALYPTALRGVKNHPPVISARGNLETLRKCAVSMVGTRHATAAGMGFMADLASQFASHGFAIASGMAAGTDAAAHRGALRAPGDTNTIAVVAGGVDYIWPVENESLYHQILERGVVISEMPVGFVPVATNFVQRNRWVAGICEKLILGEADAKSGSMVTARFAMDFGREIWAIPSHPTDSRGAGPNSLIQSGRAKLCMGASDFFAAQPKTQKKEKNVADENPLLDKIGIVPVSESVLAQVVKKTISEIKRDLVVLELQGLIRKTDGGYVRI
ncbi:MAG: DNA-protecting protein DprA [Alphaproteobacteria bacterium]|nr:DNA-protecting protein DprA [Alphaproteobacteria bacterium]